MRARTYDQRLSSESRVLYEHPDSPNCHKVHWTVADIGVGAWVDVAARARMLADLPATEAWLRRLRALPFWSRADGYELLASAPESRRREFTQ